MRILLVEDEIKVGRFVEKGLTEANYSVHWVKTCKEADAALSDNPFDLIILDLTLPDGDGLDLLREWRAYNVKETVIILSARDSVNDRIAGLNLGADDYLPKPFSFGELLARIRSQLRRSSSEKTTVLEHRGIRMDLLAHEVSFNGEAMELTRREYSLLEIFLQNRGRALTRTQIGEKIWDAQYDMQTNLIDVYVVKLRKRFEPKDGLPIIKTVRGIGYMMP